MKMNGAWSACFTTSTTKCFPQPISIRLPAQTFFVDVATPIDIIRAILGHATYTGVPRDTDMARALFATDELCGFLVACALVRPSRSLDDMEVSSVKKKLKDKAFARSVNRDDIKQGVEELGVEYRRAHPLRDRCVETGAERDWVEFDRALEVYKAICGPAGRTGSIRSLRAVRIEVTTKRAIVSRVARTRVKKAWSSSSPRSMTIHED